MELGYILIQSKLMPPEGQCMAQSFFDCLTVYGNIVFLCIRIEQPLPALAVMNVTVIRNSAEKNGVILL